MGGRALSPLPRGEGMDFGYEWRRSKDSCLVAACDDSLASMAMEERGWGEEVLNLFPDDALSSDRERSLARSGTGGEGSS